VGEKALAMLNSMKPKSLHLVDLDKAVPQRTQSIKIFDPDSTAQFSFIQLRPIICERDCGVQAIQATGQFSYSLLQRSSNFQVKLLCSRYT